MLTFWCFSLSGMRISVSNFLCKQSRPIYLLFTLCMCVYVCFLGSAKDTRFFVGILVYKVRKKYLYDKNAYLELNVSFNLFNYYVKRVFAIKFVKILWSCYFSEFSVFSIKFLEYTLRIEDVLYSQFSKF